MAKKKAKKVGLDAGNGNSKFMFEGWEKGLLIPTVEAVVLNPKSNFQSKEVVNADNIHDHLDITYVLSKAAGTPNRRYLIGSKALRDQDVVVVETDSRARKEEEELIARVALAGLVVDAIKSNPDKQKIVANYDLSLALPIIGATREGFELHARRFIGTHEMIYHYPNGEKVEVTIIVEFAFTNAEGAIGAYSLVYDLKANLKKYDYKDESGKLFKDVTIENRELLVADIGANTFDVAPLTGVILDSQNVKGYNLGTKETIERLRDDWNDEHEQDQLESLADFNRTYSATNSTVSNQLQSFAEPYIEVGASKIADTLKKRIRKMSSEALIFVFGGGSMLYKQTLNKKLSQYTHKLYFVDNPIFINAEGLLIFALIPAFEQLKQKYLKELENNVNA